MNQPKRTLKVNMDDLEIAFETHGGPFETTFYLDLKTGELVMVTEDDRLLLKRIRAEHGDPETGEVDWDKVLPLLDIEDWQKDSLVKVSRAEGEEDEGYIPIPNEASSEGYSDMVEFIETVSNPRLQSQLERAIQGKGAFRHFKDVLIDFPKERERWFLFKQEQLHQRILDWLEAEGIEAI